MESTENAQYYNNKNIIDNGIVFNSPKFIVILVIRDGSAEGIIRVYNL